MINYDGRVFRPESNTENGETSSDTVFLYRQIGNILTSEYSGGRIIRGHLIGLVDENGNIDMRYHQVNDRNEIMTGMCRSTPEIKENGRIRLHESWQWTSGDRSEGRSVLEEVGPSHNATDPS
ncbi:MAG: n-acetylglutamate synthase [Flavobacteriales bacterium]